jgi:hypothetical protein
LKAGALKEIGKAFTKLQEKNEKVNISDWEKR